MSQKQEIYMVEKGKVGYFRFKGAKRLKFVRGKVNHLKEEIPP